MELLALSKNFMLNFQERDGQLCAWLSGKPFKGTAQSFSALVFLQIAQVLSLQDQKNSQGQVQGPAAWPPQNSMGCLRWGCC